MIIQQLAMLYMKKANLSNLTPKQMVKKYNRVVKQMKAEDKNLHKRTHKSNKHHQVGFH